MKTDLFQHEITNTSAVFGRHSEVRVVFEGDGAKTDHETIWLPALPQGTEIGEREQGIFRGYTDHEAGHIRHTDRKALVKATPKFKANPRLHSVWNALEDVWLERRVIAEYPGARRNLIATSSAVDQQALDALPAEDVRWKDDKFIGPVAITWEGRKGYGHDTGLKCLERVSDDLKRQLPVWVKAVDACKTTSDVLKLAEVILGEIESGSYKTPGEGETTKADADKGDGKPGDGDGANGDGSKGDKGEGDKGSGDAKGGGDGDKGGDGTAGDGDGARGGDAGGDGPVPDRKPAPEEKDVKQQTEQGGTAGGDRGNVTNDYGTYDDFKLEDVVKREAQKLTKQSQREGSSYRAFTTARDKWHTRHDANGLFGHYTYGETMRSLAKNYPNAYSDRLLKASGDINVVRRKLERVLAAKMNRGWEGGHEQGKFDSRRMVQAFRAEPKVYKVREPMAELDTAVQLLVDLSGSMSRTKASVATDVVCVLVEVLSKVNIPVEVLGFNAKSGHFTRSGVREADHGWAQDAHNHYGQGYARFEPIDMYVFKAFDERLHDAKPVIGTIAQHAGGNNIDGESLMYAYPRLLKRSEQRKVLMVLSDGAPACGGDNPKLHKHLMRVVKDINSRGVECIGIGICTEAVEQYYPRNVVVNEVADLGRNAIDQLAKVLVGERYVVDNRALMGAA